MKNTDGKTKKGDTKMTFKGAKIRLYSFTANGKGINLPETKFWYVSPREGKQAARSILEKYPHVGAVCVRKERDVDIKTITIVQR